MRSSRSSRHAVPIITPPSEAYLPGLAPPDGGTSPPEPLADTPYLGWWVKRSEQQAIDATGQPAGFKHTLMLGHTIMGSAVGADGDRTFQQQAEYLNARDERASR